MEGGGLFLKFFTAVLFLDKKLGHFLLNGRSQLELVNNQELYNDWASLDSGPSCCHFNPFITLVWVMLESEHYLSCDAYNVYGRPRWKSIILNSVILG